MGLGVSTSFSRGRNLEIITEHWKADPKLTRAQTNFLKHFPSFEHQKGVDACSCLGCDGIKLLNRLEGK